MAPIGVDDDQQELLRAEANEPVFRSGAAREDFERARRLRNVRRVLLGILLLVGWSLGMYRIGRGRYGQAGAQGDRDGAAARFHMEPVGSPDALVKVECILPADTDCHAAIIQFLTETSVRNAGNIRVEFSAMNDYGEAELKAKVGEFCAAVLINGKVNFEFEGEDGRKVRVNLVGTVPTHYGLDDIGRALEHVYTLHYGEPDRAVYQIPKGLVDQAYTIEEESSESPTTEELREKLPAFREIEFQK